MKDAKLSPTSKTRRCGECCPANAHHTSVTRKRVIQTLKDTFLSPLSPAASASFSNQIEAQSNRLTANSVASHHHGLNVPKPHHDAAAEAAATHNMRVA